MKFKILKFKKVTSTNDVAINLIKKKKYENGCVYADVQTKGRGSHGKKWVSDKGNLFGSVFFLLKENYPSFHEFAVINPVIISAVIQKFCHIKGVTLKWPNDLLVNKKKICGILQELVTFNNRKFLIVGIGINIISNPNINTKYQTTNILDETQKKPPIKKLIKLITLSYEGFFLNLKSYNYISLKKLADSMVVNK